MLTVDLRAAAKIKRKNLINNLNIVREAVGDDCKILAIVKADAYGHGAVECAKVFIENGADALAVATFSEAKELRDAGIDSEIVILAELIHGEEQESQKLNLVSTVFSAKDAQELGHTATEGKPHRVHLKIDTGMSRAGIYCQDLSLISVAADEAEKIYSTKGIVVEGIYTHFSSADSGDRSATDKQFQLFYALISELEKRGINPGIRHCSASSGLLYYPEYSLDMVRPGIMLYGYSPKPGDEFSQKLIPVMTLEARVIKTTRLRKYDKISYGGTYTAPCEMDTATVAIGYGDGYSRLLSGIDYFLINGKKAKACGRVCMDVTVFDVTDIDCNKGDMAVVFGESGKTADDIAAKLGTISYEVLCGVGKRIPRIYE